MLVYEASFDDVQDVVRRVSLGLYDGNLTIRTGEDRSNRAGPRSRFTLRTIDSAGTGAKGAASWSSTGTGPWGLRRTMAACWHAHYDVLDELFTVFPTARVVTAIATYTTATFHERALATASLNIGSRARPVTAPECCECHHTPYTTHPTRTADPYRDGDRVVMPSVDAMRPNPDVPYFLDELDRALTHDAQQDERSKV